MMADLEEVATCYGAGSVVGAIIGTFLITLGLLGAAALLYNIYWRSRKGKHLVLVTDAENPEDQYAFDNPGFREATPIKQSLNDRSDRFEKSWLGSWSPLNAFTPKGVKLRSADDSFVNDLSLRTVSLQSRDFTGLGFSVCGNMRDGIFVKDVLHHGPAAESGSMHPGDRIDSVCISFRHMVFEDALTILSYASPYEVQVQVQTATASSRPSTLVRCKAPADRDSGPRVRHPFYRSQSSADLSQISKTSRKSNLLSVDKPQETSLTFSDYPTLKLSTSQTEPKKESQHKKWPDAPDGNDTSSRVHKYGVKVLPANLSPQPKHNEQKVAAAAPQESEPEGSDVKALITKSFQTLKEKINQNTLGRKKKDVDVERAESPPSPEILECKETLDVMAKAGEAAKNYRLSSSHDQIARRSIEVVDSGGDSSGEDGLAKAKKTKGKAPAPPQGSPQKSEPSPTSQRHSLPVNTEEIHPAGEVTTDTLTMVEPQPMVESDSEVEEREGCTQATVHHTPSSEDAESGRKTASLGDLSRLEASPSSGPLERAVSLELDASQSGKKRKAPPPPADDFPGFYDRKEPRLEGYNTFQRRLKKSSDFGTMEDALQDGSDSDPECLETHSLTSETPEPIIPESTQPTLSLTPEPNPDAASKIQEFTSWLEEARKPQPETTTLTLSVNGVSEGGSSVVVASESVEVGLDNPSEDSSIDTSNDVTLSVNGQILPDQSRTVVVISSEEAEDDTPPQLPTSPIPSTPTSSMTYITEIKVSPEASAKASKPTRKDLSPETSKIPIRTMKSETGQKVLAAIQSMAARDSLFKEEGMTTPPAVPPRRADTALSWAEDKKVNGTPAHLPVKTSATKIVFENTQVSNEQF